MGMQMNAWFDLLDLSPGSKQDDDGIKQSSQTCNNSILFYQILSIIIV